jgi:hypothetical protein
MVERVSYVIDDGMAPVGVVAWVVEVGEVIEDDDGPRITPDR